MPRKRTPKTEQTEAELLRRVLEKFLIHRALVYAPLYQLDLITPSVEQGFDEVLLKILARLGVSLEIHDPVRGAVERFDHRKMTKTRRWQTSREWNANKKTKRETLRFVDQLPDLSTLPIPKRCTFRFRPRPRRLPYGENE